MKELELMHVYKDYKLAGKEKYTALSDINVSFEKGELVSIIGESGSGKSTLMNLIGGLDSDYQGIINIGGKDLKNFKDKQLDDYRKKKIGFVFQSFNLIPHLSVLDNVTIPLTLSNIKESEKNEKAIKILTQLGLKEHIKKKPTQLSGGQKQRVAIARALINDPDIILADEPTGALDSSTTIQILDILKDIADDGKLVIMVTHSEKVAKISSRIVEISDGKIIRDEKNKNYTKNNDKHLLGTNNMIENKDKKEGHLSFISALKLSFHNMWASKTKNFLMALGVSISLIAMIIMLSFGSGLTSYISTLAEDYSNPYYVTLSKSGKDKDGNPIEENQDPASMFIPKMFEENEINEIITDLNNYLETQNNDFRITTEGDNQNLTYGFSMMTMASGTISYDPQTGNPEDIKTSSIMYTYTTPPYYDDHNLITETGHMSGENEIMLSSAILKLLDIEDPEEIVGKQVILNINLTVSNTQIIINKDVTISAIVDVSAFSSMMVMYVDYDFLNNCVKEAQQNASLEPTGLNPSLLFIYTDSEETTDLLNYYIENNRKDLSGSIEEELSSMFSEMMSTFSIALAIISGISLIVALIMITVVLYMSVSERTREIGVLKSIGARKKDIKLIFSTESLLIGILSGITGIIFSAIIGGILALIFNSLLGFAPINMLWYYFVGALFISIIISVLAGLYPSSKAAKLDPVESLRHE